MQGTSQLSESTCPQLQHLGTRQLTGVKEPCWAKQKFYFLKKMGQSGDRKQDFSLVLPKKTIASCPLDCRKCHIWLTLGK